MALRLLPALALEGLHAAAVLELLRLPAALPAAARRAQLPQLWWRLPRPPLPPQLRRRRLPPPRPRLWLVHLPLPLLLVVVRVRLRSPQPPLPLLLAALQLTPLRKLRPLRLVPLVSFLLLLLLALALVLLWAHPALRLRLHLQLAGRPQSRRAGQLLLLLEAAGCRLLLLLPRLLLQEAARPRLPLLSPRRQLLPLLPAARATVAGAGEAEAGEVEAAAEVAVEAEPGAAVAVAVVAVAVAVEEVKAAVVAAAAVVPAAVAVVVAVAEVAVANYTSLSRAHQAALNPRSRRQTRRPQAESLLLAALQLRQHHLQAAIAGSPSDSAWRTELTGSNSEFDFRVGGSAKSRVLQPFSSLSIL